MSVAQIPDLGNGLQNFRIAPSNNPANNTFSHQSNPVLSFELPSSNVILNLRTLRLVGKMRIRYNTAPLGVANTRIDQYLGVNSIFQNVSWSSKNSRAVIERITNYPQLINTLLPALKDSSAFRNELGVEMLSSQSNNFTEKWILQKMVQNEGRDGLDFSTPIFTGMTMASGDKIPLMPIGGLLYTCELAPSSAVFNTTDAQQPEYEIFDVALVGSYYVPENAEREAIASMGSGEVEINTFTPLYSTVQSTNQTQTYSLGLSDVISVLWSFVPASFINNYQFNQNQHMRITQGTSSNQLVKINALRNGVQLPFNYDLNVEPQSLEAELHKYYLMALKKIQDITHSAVDATTNDIRFAYGASGLPITAINQRSELNKLNVAYGVPYDVLGDLAGVNFAGSPLTLELQSTLADGTSNAQFVFVLHKAKVAYGAEGIRVMN